MYEVLEGKTGVSRRDAVDPRSTADAPLMVWKSRFFATALFLAASAGYAFGQNKVHSDFRFVNVADTTQGFTNFGTFPAINDHGVVAFEATGPGAADGMFRWKDGSILQIAKSSSGGLSLFGADPAINAGGTVVFEANLAPGVRAIFTSDGVSTKTIVNSNDKGLIGAFLGAPSINRSGKVAFFGIRKGFGSQAVFVGDGDTLTPVVDTLNSDFTSFQNVAINASGEVVFVANRTDDSTGLFVVNAGKHRDASEQPIDIVDTNNSDLAGFGDPVINKSGTIANDVSLKNSNVEILSADRGGVTARTDVTGANFVVFDHPSINDSDAVAFLAFEVDGNLGIFIEPTGGASPVPVIRTGDELFGSVVTSVDIGRFALNNRFAMAIQYSLEDGRIGVAIASLKRGGGQGEREDEME